MPIRVAGMETKQPKKMIPITKEEADAILHEHLHQKLRSTRVIACYKGQWFDIRGLSKTEIIINVKKVFGYLVNPDAMM